MRIWLHEPIEREQTVLNMATMIIIVRVAFFLDRCMWLIKNATATGLPIGPIASKTLGRETVEVRAATVRSKKNNADHNADTGI